MKEETFYTSKFSTKRELRTGQKVECVYYHELTQLYANKSKNLLDYVNPFTPVKLGVIVGDAGRRPYYLAGFDGKEQYLYVKFKEYLFKKAIPISCIYDAKESTEKMERMLKEDAHRLGEKGYEKESFDWFKKRINENKEFIK